MGGSAPQLTIQQPHLGKKTLPSGRCAAVHTVSRVIFFAMAICLLITPSNGSSTKMVLKCVNNVGGVITCGNVKDYSESGYGVPCPKCKILFPDSRWRWTKWEARTTTAPANFRSTGNVSHVRNTYTL